jgi:glycosyltransferase involved in cell wall biosynthesis
LTASDDKRPKVLRVITRLNLGGPARHVVILNAGLARFGWNTLLVYGRLAPGEESLDRLVAEHNLPACHLPQLGRRIRVTDDLRAFLELVRLIFRFRPDVVHTHTAKAGVLGRLAAALFNVFRSHRRRCVVVHTFHGHVLEHYFGRVASVLIRTAERALATITDRIVAISTSQRTDLVERFRIARADKVRVIPLGLELQPLLSLPPRSRCASGIVTFGYMGRFVEIKNLPLLLQAFARACAAGCHAKLVLAGGGQLQRSLVQLTADLGITDRVTFTGWRRRLEEFYESVDVIVLSSRNEGTPVALIEAMAAGRAILATRVGGVPDVVRHEETGLLVESEDLDAMSDAIGRLAGDGDLRSRLGDAARRDVAARYPAERLVEDVRGLYEGALRSARNLRRG